MLCRYSQRGNRRACPVQSGLVKDPLRLRVEQGDERFVGDFAIEPQVHAGDGRHFELLEMVQRGIGVADFWRQEIGDAVVRESENEGIGSLFPCAVENRCIQSSTLETQAAY